MTDAEITKNMTDAEKTKFYKERRQAEQDAWKKAFDEAIARVESTPELKEHSLTLRSHLKSLNDEDFRKDADLITNGTVEEIFAYFS